MSATVVVGVLSAPGAVAYLVEVVLDRNGVEVGKGPGPCAFVAFRPEVQRAIAGIPLALWAEGGRFPGGAEVFEVLGVDVGFGSGFPVAEPAGCGAC